MTKPAHIGNYAACCGLSSVTDRWDVDKNHADALHINLNTMAVACKNSKSPPVPEQKSLLEKLLWVRSVTNRPVATGQHFPFFL
ncbi:unnamed protein product [Nezara viridula]|uniref:Uncharacterized protein n=1 Tax=Nezara viridula TaxID=85310 RepID=A0A9P0H6T1_NEZVI|nr:unnamed protein product [Nezara viridula]